MKSFLVIVAVLQYVHTTKLMTSVMTPQTTFSGQQHATPPYYRGQVNNVVQCQALCAYQPKCASFNYSPATKFCELIEDSNLVLQANRNKIFAVPSQRPPYITTPGCADHEICVHYGSDLCRCFPFLESGCGSPSPVTGSDVNVTSTSISSTVSYECSVGYKYISGTKTSTCRDDGTWTDVDLICNEIDCGPPTAINGTEVVATSTTFNNTAMYTCQVGYTDNGGGKSSVCQLDETWSSATLNCTIRDCGWPDYLDGALANYTSTTYGSVVSYTCLTGFTSTGDGTSRCLEDGQWTSISLGCTASPHRTWTHVATTASGSTSTTELDALTTSISSSCAKKLKLKVTIQSSTRMMSTQYHGIFQSKKVAHTVKALSKSSWKAFESTPVRLFDRYVHSGPHTHLEVSLTGQKDMTNSDAKCEWYFDDDDTSPYTADSSNLKSTILSGAIDSYEDLFQLHETTLSSQLGGSISQNEAAFLFPPYWYVVKTSSDGKAYVIRWWLGGGYNSQNSNSQYKTWCLDDKWNLIMSNAADEFERTRLILHLTGGVRLGRNIVVHAAKMVSSATDSYVHNGHVVVSIPEHWVPAGASSFSSSSFLRWLLTSTRGVLKKCKHVPESNTVDTIEEEETPTSWFLDSRIWVKTLTIDSNGNVLQGSRSDLSTSVSSGTVLRVGVQHTSGLYHAMSVDNVEFSGDSHIAAEMIHRPHLVPGTDSTLGFTATCSVRSSIIATDGTYVQYVYNLGVEGSHVNVADVQYIEWFLEG